MKKALVHIQFALIFYILVSTNSIKAQTEESIPAIIQNNGLSPRLSAQIKNFSIRKMEELHSPGLAVGIVQGETLVFSGYFGFANIEENKAVKEDTLFRIGSISKTMTTIGLMQLWEKGKFNLDDDINKYFPKPLIFPPHPETKPVTFRHLLTHTSGGGEFLSYKQAFMPGFGVMVKGDNYLPLEEYLKLGMHNKLDPGIKWAYCNYGFAFLGYAIERIAGKPFHLYMEENVLKPLGMTETTFHHNDKVLSHLATGYKYTGKGYEADHHKPVALTPAGSVYTNVNDFSKYVIALLNGGKNKFAKIIKPETLKMIMDTHYTLDERQSGWGLGFEIYSNNLWGKRIVGHSGSVPWGFTSLMLLVPEDRLGVYVFSNSGTYAPKEICFGILKMIIDGKDRLIAEIPPDFELWKDLVGYYGPEFRDFKTSARLYMAKIGVYQVEIMDNELRLIYLWQGKKKSLKLVQLSPDDPYFFQVLGKKSIVPQYISFKTDDSGKVKYIITDGLNEYIKLPKERIIKAKLASIPGKILLSITNF